MSRDETITLRCTVELKAKLEAIAKANDMPVSQLVRRAVNEFLDRKDKESAHLKNNESVPDFKVAGLQNPESRSALISVVSSAKGSAARKVPAA